MMAAAQAAAEAALRAEEEAEQRRKNTASAAGQAAQQEQQFLMDPWLGAIMSPQDQHQVDPSHYHPPMDNIASAGINNSHSAEADASGLQAQQVLQGLLGNIPNGANRTNDLLNLLAEEEHRETEQMVTEPVANLRPEEHYMTIAQNGHGTILEATQTVTGFPPDALLMTSSYDIMYDEDLPAYLCVKTQFWDRGRPDVGVYIRRRTIEGELIWLEARALDYISEPIPGIIVVEKLAADEQLARELNRRTRITAILIQAAEAARLAESKPPPPAAEAAEGEPQLTNGGAESAENSGTDPNSVLQSLIGTLQETGSHDDEAMQELIKIVASDGAVDQMKEPGNQEVLENSGQQKKGFDPFAMMESVRKGVRLDLGLTQLLPEEIKLIALVMTGKLGLDHVAQLVLEAFQSGIGLAHALSDFRLENERDKSSPRKSFAHNAPRSFQPQLQQSLSMREPPPPIAVANLSYCFIGNSGIDMLAEVLYMDGSALMTLDVSFCNIDEKGILSLARALQKRKKKQIAAMRGLILSGNYISARAASELGVALATPNKSQDSRRKKRSRKSSTGGYDTDNSSDEGDDDFDFQVSSRNDSSEGRESRQTKSSSNESTLQLLHLACTSLKPEAIGWLLEGLGPNSTLKELSLASNNFGPSGTSALVRFLEGSDRSRSNGQVPMPKLDRLDMSNNNLGDDGATQLTRAIAKRSQVHFVELRLSSNSISAGGVETIMNKLLHHNLVSLSLYKNEIGDQGCQLVAASLLGMKSLARLNLSFNQIGSRGIISLMRSLIGCDSVTFLGLSGNIIKIQGAIALAFTLAQHPRLEELHLDNCCLGQAAQCHIIAGIISNRWVPMKRLLGCAVGPPMVAIGALKSYAQNLTNEECLNLRKNEQMKTILQWMDSNRRRLGHQIDPEIAAAIGTDSADQRFLSPDIVSSINDVHGTPSQNAYFRLLGWLSNIPFDDDELTALQKYFYESDGNEGDRGSDWHINLKARGDLLAALDSEVADEFREELPSLAPALKGSVAIDLDKLYSQWDPWKAIKGETADAPPVGLMGEEDKKEDNPDDAMDGETSDLPEKLEGDSEMANDAKEQQHLSGGASPADSGTLGPPKEKRLSKVKARITMFPNFEQQLEELKATAAEMIEQEEDPMQHEVILTQYAEASLTILRQLRYHCMNSGLDGWRQGGLKRKVLIVDDSRVTRKLVSRAFEKANFIVDTASNGQEGVEKLKGSIYDIAFMDIDMPIMNGFEATKKLREWEDSCRPGARQPICALTATYVDDFKRSELMKFKEAGLDVMESKPCNIPRLFKVVDDVSPMFSDLTLRDNQLKREKSDSELQS